VWYEEDLVAFSMPCPCLCVCLSLLVFYPIVGLPWIGAIECVYVYTYIHSSIGGGGKTWPHLCDKTGLSDRSRTSW